MTTQATTQTARLEETRPTSEVAEPAEPLPGQLAHTGPFAALHNHDYRLFWSGSLASNIGMWMQQVAQGWLVVSLTQSEFLVGLVAFFAMAPMLLFSLFGGVLADRRDKRHVLMVSQVISSLLVATLATLIYTGRVELWHVMAISFGTGTTMALTSPSWQAIVPEMVGKGYLLNAIALNSAQFNLTRVLGPTLGGILIRYIGIAGCYYLNSVSYLVFLLAMAFVRPKHAPRRAGVTSEGVFRSLASALSYVRGHSVVRTVMLLAVVQTLFLFPYSTLLPVFAKQVLGLGAGGYGLLLSAAGIGALAGALILAFRGEIRSKGRVMIASQVVFALGVAAFAFSGWLVTSMVALVFIGWAFVTFLATGNTWLQTLVPDELRGRVMSIWMLAGLGIAPIGSLQAGAVAALVSPAFALVLGAAVTLAFTLAVALRQRALFATRPATDPQPAAA